MTALLRGLYLVLSFEGEMLEAMGRPVMQHINRLGGVPSSLYEPRPHRLCDRQMDVAAPAQPQLDPP